jgi:fermentation-respiration switch protein FrsA (DUF1100 family)
MADAESATQEQPPKRADGARRVVRFLRNVAILLGGALATLYLGALVYLYVSQRDLLFQRDTAPLDAPEQGSIYHASQILEPDGTRLTIWQAPAARRGLGTFVLFYGNAASVLEFADTGEEIHREGFAVVLASYRGYSGNSGSPSEAGLMSDARAVLAALPKDSGPIVLWGHSLGSGVAARMASEGRASALVLESPFTAAVEVAANAYPFFPVRLLMRDRFDTLALVPRIQVPVLILHGTEDQAIPFAMGATLARAFGRRATLVPVLGADHNPDPVDLWPSVRAWLRAHWDAIQGSKAVARK